MSTPRLVILAREGLAPTETLRRLRADGALCLVTSSAYEAAAELLAAPTLALVLDLGLLTRSSLGLLRVARRMEVEALAFGNLPSSLSAEELSGLRLTGLGELPAAVRALAEAQEARPAEKAAPPAERPAEQAPAPPSPTPEPSAPAPSQPAPGAYEPVRPRDLLTPEELAALLGRQP